MLSMASQIELFEEMSALSARMVAAAQGNDWEQLVDLERSVVALRAMLMTDDYSLLSPAEVEMKRALIQRILDDDAEIRRHTEPWMERVRQFLGSNARAKPIEGAYGASA